jgi:hypothetical protein
MRLIACPACSRHGRAADAVCAFCGTEFSGASGKARIAIAVALVAAAAMGCDGQKEIAQPYGVPMPPNDGRDAAANPVTPDAPDAGSSGAPIVAPPTK